MAKGSKPAGASEGAKDLAWAQEKFDELMKKKFPDDELSTLEQLWKGSALSSDEAALARLLYVRAQLQQHFMDMRKLHELVKDAEACLQPLVEGRGNRSATALGLLAAWYGRILDIHEPAANAIAALWDQLPGTTEKELAGWRDPADELLLGGKGPLFVDKAGAIAGDKAERIAALQKVS